MSSATVWTLLLPLLTLSGSNPVIVLETTPWNIGPDSGSSKKRLTSWVISELAALARHGNAFAMLAVRHYRFSAVPWRELLITCRPLAIVGMSYLKFGAIYAGVCQKCNVLAADRWHGNHPNGGDYFRSHREMLLYLMYKQLTNQCEGNVRDFIVAVILGGR